MYRKVLIMEIRTEKGSQINDNVPTYPKFVLENRIKKRSYLKTTFSQSTEYFIERLFFIVDTEVPKVKTASKNTEGALCRSGLKMLFAVF